MYLLHYETADYITEKKLPFHTTKSFYHPQFRLVCPVDAKRPRDVYNA